MKTSHKSSFRGQVKEASQERKRDSGNYGYLKLPNGISVFSAEPDTRVTLDFLPYLVTMKNHPDKNDKTGRATKDSYWYRLPFKTHRNVGVNNDSVVCLTSFGKKCPICEYKAKRAKEGADKEELAALRTSDRFLYVVNPLDSKKHDAGKWHIFDISNAMFQKMLDEELEEDSISEVFMDLVEGESLKIRFTGKTIGNSKPFPEATKITAVERDKPYKLSVQDETPKLDEVLTILTYEELEQKFFEIEEDDIKKDEDTPKRKKKVVEEEDEEEEPIRKKKTVDPPAKKKPVIEEEEDEPEEEEEDSLTWDDLTAMKMKQLKNYIKANDLDVDPDDYEEEAELREAIAVELEIEVPKKSKPKTAKQPRCPACKGTGKDAKGRVCKVCLGTGVKQADPDPEEEEEDEEEEVAPPKKKGQETASKKCPSGHKFGVDVDKFEDCDECELWDACMVAKRKSKG